MDEKHYTTGEAAKETGFREQTFRRAAAEGRIKTVKVGVFNMIPKSEVMKWKEKRNSRNRTKGVKRKSSKSESSDRPKSEQ